MDLEKCPMLYAAWTKWKSGCSNEELVEWIRSLSREENARLGEELGQMIYEEYRERRKIDKYSESLGMRSYALPIFLGELMEKCKFWENRSKRENDQERSTSGCTKGSE